MRRSVLAFSALVLALVLAACGDDGVSPEDSPVGIYTLVSVNGGALPYVAFQILDDKVEITSGSISLNEDRTCRSLAELRLTEAGSVTTETEDLTCTWQSNNNALLFTWDDGGADAASWSGDQLVFTAEGVVFLFER